MKTGRPKKSKKSDVKFVLRLPKGIDDKLNEESKLVHHSKNNLLIAILSVRYFTK